MANSEVEDKSPAIPPFLIKIYGENVNQKYRLNGRVVNIGRHPKSHIKVDSINVSRNHCVLRCEKDTWIIKDNNSQNGTYINGKKLEKKQEYILQCGDIVFLGPPSENPQAFSFDDYPEEVDHIWTSPIKEKEYASSSRVSTQSYGESHSVQSSKDPEILEIKKSEENSNKINSSTSISSKKNDKLADTLDQMDIVESFAKKVHGKTAKKNCKNIENRELNISSESQGLSLKSQGLSLKSQGLSLKSKPPSSQNAGCSSVPHSHQVEENSQSLLDIEEDGLFDQDSYPFSQMLGESKSAASNNEQINLNNMETNASIKSEINLKDNDNELLKSKLALLSEEIKHLEHSKSNLLKEYVDVCEKNKMLDQQLVEQQKLKDDMLMCEMRVKNKFKSQIMEKLEEDLICNICTELLIQPTVLDCSHTFCEHCISEWKKKKGQCPICRNQIKSMTRILALDHFIDKTLETLTPGEKEKRKELVSERERSKNPPPRPSPSRGRARRRGRGRRYSYNRRPIRPSPISPLPQPVPAVHIPEVIQLDDSSVFNRVSPWLLEISLSDTDNDSSIEMMDNYLQPCYNCGRYDHMHYECPG